MYTFKELRNACRLNCGGQEIKAAILGNCSTQFFAMAVEGYARLNGLNLRVYDADYDQIEAQLFDENSEVYRFSPDYIILWLASNKLYEEFLDMPMEDRDGFADSYIRKIKGYWQLISERSHARILQMNFTEIDDKALGQYSAKVSKTFVYQIRKLNWLLEEAMSQNSNVYPVDLLAVQIRLGGAYFYDAAFYYNAKMSVSTKALPYVAKAVVDILRSMCGKIRKCVVMDLDNTLWGGVIGDDGMDHIEIGELGRGPAFTDLQRWLKQLKECGIILAVCSKNDEEIAREPFEKHEEMILRLSDISVFVANWDDKAANIRLIQESLNIGMDSIVFLDDNPFERNLVREMLPEVEVPELPSDPAEYLGYLQSQNYFDTVSFSEETADRTKLYQAEFERRKTQAAYRSLDEYLESLGMVSEVRPFDEMSYPRIAQLTQRSNQFNLRTIRYTEDDIRRIVADRDHYTASYTLSDRFGGYGLVGVVILRRVAEDELFMDTWLMSCRVLKRGMEEFIMNTVVRAARELGIQKISAEYIPTAKNKMVRDLYTRMGFYTISENRYGLDVGTYQMKKTYIQEAAR